MMKYAELFRLAVGNFAKMGLDTLTPAEDFRGSKPDLVVIHTDKNKYYLAEIITEACLQSGSRLRSNRPDDIVRRTIAKLYPNKREAAVVAALFTDLGRGIDLFRYTELKGYYLFRMEKYASCIYPIELAKEIESVFTKLNLQFKSLEVLNTYCFTLFSQSDTNKMAEARKFMKFLARNKAGVPADGGSEVL